MDTKGSVVIRKAMTKVSTVELGGNRAKSRRKLHKRNSFIILQGIRENILTASMKQQDAIKRTLRKLERAL